MASNVITPEFRVSYPRVFKPEKNDLSGEMEFTVSALFKKGENLSALKKAAEEACEEKWGKDKSKWPKNLKSPFKDQGTREKEKEVVEIKNGKETKTVKTVMPDGYEKGAMYLNLKSRQKPGLVDQSLNDIIDASEFYGGCYARASVRAMAYDMKVNKGVSFWLQNLQKTRDGESFGGRTAPQDDFEPIAAAGAEASTGESDDIFG